MSAQLLDVLDSLGASLRGEVVTPLIIAIGTLLAMISLRNSDIATRSRANVDEALYKLSKVTAGRHCDERLKCIREQNVEFGHRYLRLSRAFNFAAFAIFPLALALLMIAYKPWARVAGALVLASLLSLLAALILMWLEMRSGPTTLQENDRSLVDAEKYRENK